MKNLYIVSKDDVRVVLYEHSLREIEKLEKTNLKIFAFCENL